VKLDLINPGKWFSEQFAPMIDAGKVLIQKSGYYSRAAAANTRDLELIRSCVDTAVETALSGGTGLVGHDEERGDELRAIEFDRIKGGKNFDIDAPWFGELLAGIGQPKRARVVVEH
jgi:pyrophosphate--fructose-6-phosphate 1-phosphotransferase